VITAVLFDIGGVLVELDGVPTLAKLMALAAAAVTELELPVTAEWFLEAFNDWRRLQPGALELLDDIPKRYRVAALSNTSVSHWERIEAMGLAQRFERLYLSHRIGRPKPSRQAFETALDDLAAAPSAVLFLDDIQSNVSAARARGLHAEVVADPREARIALEQYSVLQSAKSSR